MYYKKNAPKNNWAVSLIKYIRDIFVYFFPIRRFPKILIKLLYGKSIDFVFIVHARRSQDYFASIPAFSFLRRILGKSKFLRFMSNLPGKAVSVLETKEGKVGLVYVSAAMPELLIRHRKKAFKELLRIMFFARKISSKKLVVGLGGWWPIVANQGKKFKKFLEKSEMLTIGHTVTILSIVLMVEKIINIVEVEKKEFKVLVIGAGQIGAQTGDFLIRRGITNVSFMDINKVKLLKIQEKYASGKNQVGVFEFDNDVKNVLDKFHIAICATSNMNKIIKEEHIPENFIIIDDSRPEAISRNILSPTKIVLEGGLMKILEMKNDYDYGLGKDDNHFGCYCEAYALAIDDSFNLPPTIGNVGYENFLKYKDFCNKSKIHVGDFKMADKKISDSVIKNIVSERNKKILYDELV